MPRPASGPDALGGDVDLDGGVQGGRRRPAAGRVAVHRGDDLVQLAQREGGGGQRGGPITRADDVAQLRGQRRPGRIPVGAVQVHAAQAAAHPRDHQRPNQPGAVAHPHRQVRHPTDVQVAHQPRVSGQGVGQHHQVHPGDRAGGVAVAAAADPRPRAAQPIGQQIRQWASAVHPDRQCPRAGPS
jgi:hypothetical protein